MCVRSWLFGILMIATCGCRASVTVEKREAQQKSTPIPIDSPAISPTPVLSATPTPTATSNNSPTISTSSDGPKGLGQTVTCSATASDADNDALTVTYQWQRSSDGVLFSDISGAIHSTYVPTAAVGSMYVRCQASADDGRGGVSTAASPAFQVATSFDPSFGGAGIAYQGLTYGTTQATRILPAGSGNFVLPVGSYFFGGNSLNTPLFMKLDQSGKFVDSFGNHGLVVFRDAIDSISANLELNAIAYQSTGDIVACGDYQTFSNNFAGVCVRAHPNGTIDTTFGGNGKGYVVIDRSGIDTLVTDFVILPDDSIFLVGYSGTTGNSASRRIMLAKLTVNGAVDTSFQTQGFATKEITAGKISYGFGSRLVNGKIYVMGSSNTSGAIYDLVLLRYGTDGALDTTFGTSGVVTYHYSDFASVYGLDIQLQGTSNFLVTGYTFDGASRDRFLARFSLSGALDTASFGSSGIVTTHINGWDYGYRIVLKPDNSFFVLGKGGASIISYDANGGVASSFGTNGQKLYDFVGQAANLMDGFINPAGNLVAVAMQGKGQFTSSRAIGLIALNPTTGDQIEGFGVSESGIIGLGIGASGVTGDLAIGPGGKILLGGWTNWDGHDEFFAMMKLNSDATLDQSFGVMGIAQHSYSPVHTLYTEHGLSLLDDGSYLSSGSIGTAAFVAKCASNGAFDPTFGITDAGITTMTEGAASSFNVIISADSGKFFTAGFSKPSTKDLFLAKFTSAGALDTTWNVTGKLSIDVAGDDDEVMSGFRLSDGTVILGGYATNGSSSKDFAFVKIDASGSLVNAFGTSGKVNVDFSSGDDRVQQIAPLASGKTLAVGYATIDGRKVMALVQLTTDGSLDPGFGTGGKVTFCPAGDIECRGSGLALQNGKIIVVGDAVIGVDGPMTKYDLVVMRLTASGALDTTFNAGIAYMQIHDTSTAFTFGSTHYLFDPRIKSFPDGGYIITTAIGINSWSGGGAAIMRLYPND